jgi:diaminobutyrate acetyltransferase
MKKNKVELFYSCGVDDDGKIRVGSERGIALVSKGDTIFEAQRNIERALANAKGNFYYRPDIGTRQLIRTKMASVSKLRRHRGKIKPSVRNPGEGDFLRVHNFVKQCDTIETYPKHLFKIITRYLGNSCYIAEIGDRIIGFSMGMRSQRDPETFFLWQIGVIPGLRGKGVAKELVEAMERRARSLGCSKIEATVDPANRQSYRLFEGMGYVNVSEREGETIKIGGKIAAKNYYKMGRHFMVYWKTL